MDMFEKVRSLVMLWVERIHEQDIVVDVGLLLLIAGVVILWLGCACWASSIAESRGYSPKMHFFIGLLLPVVYPPVLLVGMDVKKARAPKRENRKSGEKEVESTQLEQPEVPGTPAPRQEKPVPNGTAEEGEEQTSDLSYLIIPEGEDTQAGQPVPRRAESGGPSLHPLRRHPVRSTAEGATDAGEGVEPHAYGRSEFRAMSDTLDESPDMRYRIRYAGGREVTVVGIDEVTPQYAVVRIETDEGSAQRTRIPYARIETVEPLEDESND